MGQIGKFFVAMMSIAVAGVSQASEVVDAAEYGAYVEEIVVTAQKREQVLQEVPISMSVLDSESLELRGFSRLEDISFAVPNLAITSPSGARSVQFTMRGITGQTFFPAAESSVGIFLDGVYVNNPAAQNFDLLDVERIEVLRGPQGTLYGKNASAGAINVISVKPDAERSVDFLAELGDYDHVRLQAKGRGQVAENLYASLGVGRYERDGFQDNTYLRSEYDDADAWSARGALRYDAGGRLEVNLAVDYTTEDVVPAALDTTPENRKSAQNYRSFQERDVYGVNLTADYALADTVTLTSTTAFRNYDLDRGNDSDGTIEDGFNDIGTQETAQWSQELRLASDSDSAFQWLGGVYFLNADMNDRGRYELYPDELFQLLTGLTCTQLITLQLIGMGLDAAQAGAIAAATCVDGVATARVDHETETWALFGQGSYDLSDRWTLTAGLRASWEEKSFDLRQPGPGSPLFILPGVDESFDRSDTSVDPMVSILWHANDDVNLYATIARGSKSGGFNTGAVGSAAQLLDTEFQEETLWNYELGMKGSFADGRLALNFAVFNIEYDDLQVFRIEANEQGVPSSRITNVASASSRGAELDATWAAATGLMVRAGVGYVDANYDDYTQCGQNSAGELIDCSDNQLTNAPEWTGNLNVTYTRALTSGVDLLLNGEWAYRGDVYYDVFNNDSAFQDGYSLFNASIGVVDPGGRWSATLWGNNLADEEYITIAVQGFGGQTIHTLGSPRTYGVRVTSRF